VLDLVFGDRPADYLADLGRRLDPAVQVYWTGEEVCSRAIDRAHLARVARNWGAGLPVGQLSGQRRRAHVALSHLRAFTGRSAAIAPHFGPRDQPAIQAHLGCIPALTLAAVYRQGEAYAYGAAFARPRGRCWARSSRRCCRIFRRFRTLAMNGWDRAASACGHAMRRSTIPPRARSFAGWSGDDLMTDDEVQTQ
jgi:hypothetical protein